MRKYCIIRKYLANIKEYKMKKAGFIKYFFFFLTIILIHLACSRDKTNDRSLMQIKYRGYLIAGIIDDFPPMCFRIKNNNEIIGFDIDLATEIAKRLGIRVQFKILKPDEMITMLNKGDIDIILAGMTVTDERENLLEFSRPYLKNKQVVMVLQDSSNNNLNMLKEKKAGVLNDSSSEIALNINIKLLKRLREVKKYQSNSQALADLAAKKIDAVVIDEISGKWNMAKKPGFFKILENEVEYTPYYIGIRKNDQTFKEALNKILDNIKNDTTGESISKRWFGENIFIK